ncbi:hypothetical protein [Streptomyces jeddahensis]|uniref:hypothetical protein n=1 Tax=Streptomyces jeddahensis TaxID=1716141 RepID=UPI0012FF7B4B|nr:hypothetical protein [Streptomyces jeddahensis]
MQIPFLRRLDAPGVVVPGRSVGGQRRSSRRVIGQVAEVVDGAADVVAQWPVR